MTCAESRRDLARVSGDPRRESARPARVSGDLRRESARPARVSGDPRRESARPARVSGDLRRESARPPESPVTRAGSRRDLPESAGDPRRESARPAELSLPPQPDWLRTAGATPGTCRKRARAGPGSADSRPQAKHAARGPGQCRRTAAAHWPKTTYRRAPAWPPPNAPASPRARPS